MSFPTTSTAAALLVGLLACLVAGCAAPEPPAAPGATAEPAPGPAPGWSNFTLTYAGTRLYRLPGDEPPASAWEGDPPSFCFLVPPRTRHISWELTWDPAQEMRLEIFGPRGIHGADPAPLPPGTEVALVGPLWLEYDDPPAGEWYAYAGPSSVGGPVDWALRSEWSVAAAGVGPGQTFTDKPCY